MILGELVVDVAPPDPILGPGLADEELVLRGAIGEPPRVEDERPALGELALATRERVRIEQRGRRISVRRGGRVDPVPGEIHVSRQLGRGHPQVLLEDVGEVCHALFARRASAPAGADSTDSAGSATRRTRPPRPSYACAVAAGVTSIAATSTIPSIICR